MSNLRRKGHCKQQSVQHVRRSGTVTRTKRLEVKIPAGVHTGSRVRVAGEGASAQAAEAKAIST